MGNRKKRQQKLNFKEKYYTEFGVDAPLGSCGKLVNMRAEGSALRPTGQCLSVGTLGTDERILALHRTADGVNVITFAAGNVCWHSTVVGSSAVAVGRVIGTLKSEATCAEALGEYVVIGSADGDCYLRYSKGNYTLLNRDAAIPQITIGAAEVDTVSATVGQYAFATPYTQWQSPLSEADVSAISANLRGAYRRLRESASALDAHIQPVLARYGVRLRDDSYLWISAPVIVGMGVQCADGVTVEVANDGTSFTSMSAYNVRATAFQLAATVHGGIDASWDDVVKSVDILVAAESAPLITSGDVNYRCETSTTGTRRQYLSMHFPQVDNGTTVHRLLSTEKWTVAYNITDFAALRSGKAVLNRVSNGMEVASEVVEKCVSAISHKRYSTSMTLHNRRLFSAADTATLHPAWGVEAMINVDKSYVETFEAVAVAQIGASSVVVWRGSGTGRAQSLNAMVAYPDSRATSLTVSVTVTGVEKSCRINLQPCGSMAYATAADLQPIVFEGVAAEAAAESMNIEENVTGTIEESMQMNPLVVGTTHTVCDGRVRAMGASIHHSNNVIGSPLYVFADSGVYAVPYRVSVSAYSPAVMISHRVLAEGLLPVNGAGQLCFVTDSGELCSIDKFTVVRLRGDAYGVGSMAFVTARRELWMSGTDGIEVLTAGETTFSRSEKFVGLFYSSANVPLGTTAGGAIYALDREVGYLPEVHLLTQPMELADRFVPTDFILLLNSSNCHISVTLYGDTGYSCHGMMLCRLRLNGTINSPMAVKVYSPEVSRVRIAIEGEMSADTILGGAVIKYCVKN